MNQEMNTIRAIVRAVDGNQAVVEVEAGGCGRCHEEGGCGGQSLTQMFCSGHKTYRVDNLSGAKPGDQVTVAISAGSVRRSANFAYGLPLLATIGGALLGMSLSGDVGAVLGAVGCLALSILYVGIRVRGSSGNIADRPHIVSRP